MLMNHTSGIPEHVESPDFVAHVPGRNRLELCGHQFYFDEFHR
jgi:hypothetical protein